MWHYLLLFVATLSLLACPSKPRRRAPSVPNHPNSGDVDKQLSATSFKHAGIHLVLLESTSGNGFEPVVLRINVRGVAIPVVARKAYDSAMVFSNKLDLSQKAPAVNLLLAFEEGEDNYCITAPLALVLAWTKGKNTTEIKHRLQQANAPPIDLSNNKGRLEEQQAGGGWQCS